MCHEAGNGLHDNICAIQHYAEYKSFISYVAGLYMMVVVPGMAMPMTMIVIVAMAVAVHLLSS
jgi:hypothetical protein